MPRAFVLINVESGSEGTVLSQMRSISGVKEAYFVYGVYDIVSEIEAKTMDKLKEIAGMMRRIEKVKSTLTMIAMTE